MLGRPLGAVLAAVRRYRSLASALPALADGTEDVYQQSIVPGANTAIKNVSSISQQAAREKARRQAATSPNVAQVPPVPAHRVPAP